MRQRQTDNVGSIRRRYGRDSRARQLLRYRHGWAVMLLALATVVHADFIEINFDTADGGSVNANLYGDGPHAVLLAHGAVFNKESWDMLAERLTAEGLTVLAIDFRGY